MACAIPEDGQVSFCARCAAVTLVEDRSLSKQVEAWTGNHVQILELSEAELHEATRLNEPLVESLRTDGVVLVGDLAALVTSNAGSSAR